MLTGTQEGAQRNIFTTEQICQIELIKGRRVFFVNVMT